MLRKAKSLEGYELHARDGELGTVKDVYFDDEQWRVRYLVVSTGSWLNSRTVLIAAETLTTREWDKQFLTVDLTKEQVRNSPQIETDRPLSRQREMELRDYYTWPYYWTAPMMGAGFAAISPRPLFDDASGKTGAPDSSAAMKKESDPHLRSAHAIRGYGIEALDGAIGHVEDFLIDDESWQVPFLLVDTRNWWPGKKVVVSPRQIRDMEWSGSVVNIELTRDAIRNGPEFDDSKPVSRDYIERLEAYYERSRPVTPGSPRAK